ncbi:Formyltransferase [Xylariaceae sp. FL0255]|nr:Formyltransferase [Xylariaceae sp. FL0255]
MFSPLQPARSLVVLIRTRPRLHVGHSAVDVWYFDRYPVKRHRHIGTALSHNVRHLSSSLPSPASTALKISDPLRILFCGSDAFSCASLEALHQEHSQNPGLIESIDVVIRPSKRTGRGNRKIRHPPIRDLANSLGLPIHKRDTFTGWDMPEGTNLIIAVSFGLFVPPRLLQASKYGGLNLHPSLLPDLRGPAPLHHALLRGDKMTGVSLQTLDSKAFDHGIILAQTPKDESHEDALRIPDNCTTVPQLLDIVTPVAARMLVQGLRDGLHVRPHVDQSWWGGSTAPQVDGISTTPTSAPPLMHAPKIRKKDQQLTSSNLRLCEAEEEKYNFLADLLNSDPNRSSDTGSRGLLKRRHDAIGPLWFYSRNAQSGKQTRIILHGIEEPERARRWAQHLVNPARTMLVEGPLAGESPLSNIPDGVLLSRYAIPFEEKEDAEETEDGGAQRDVESINPTNDGRAGQMTLVFWRWTDKPERDDEAALFLGHYRITSLKVEGQKAMPPLQALRPFLL